MEDHQFDELTKKLAKPVSRRTVFKAALVTAVGGMLGFGKSEGAAAYTATGKCIDAFSKSYQPIGHAPGCCTEYSDGTYCNCPPGTTLCVYEGRSKYGQPFLAQTCVAVGPGQTLQAGTCTVGCSTPVPTCGNGPNAVCCGNLYYGYYGVSYFYGYYYSAGYVPGYCGHGYYGYFGQYYAHGYTCQPMGMLQKKHYKKYKHVKRNHKHFKHHYRAWHRHHRRHRKPKA